LVPRSWRLIALTVDFQAELERRERRVAAREREFSARGSRVRGWWALRLAPWCVLDLLVAGWMLVAAGVLTGEALSVSCGVAGLLVAAIAMGRLLAGPPSGR
jgi:hypothetical protein